MRQLILLRHAKSERAAPGTPDRDRRLDGRGRTDAPIMGAYMARHRLLPNFAIVSAAARARETWELVAPAFQATPPAVVEERIYNANLDKLFDVIRETASEMRRLLVVGHNPGLHEFAAALIAAGDVETRQRLNEGLPTAGLVVIDLAFDDWTRVHPHAGRLDRFVTPRSLAAATE